MTTWTYSDERKGFRVYANEAIKAGSEVFVNYGSKPNWRFLIWYGFLLDENPNNVYLFKVGINGTDPLKDLKEELLDREIDKDRPVPANTDSGRFSKAMSLLRYVVFNGTSEELKAVLVSFRYLGVDKGEVRQGRGGQGGQQGRCVLQSTAHLCDVSAQRGAHSSGSEEDMRGKSGEISHDVRRRHGKAEEGHADLQRAQLHHPTFR